MLSVACHKIPYASQGQAVVAAKQTAGQRAYLCPHCDHWHLSSKSKRDVKRARKLGREVKPHRPKPGLVERKVDDGRVNG